MCWSAQNAQDFVSLATIYVPHTPLIFCKLETNNINLFSKQARQQCGLFCILYLFNYETGFALSKITSDISIGRAITNVVRTCGLTHLLILDFMSNKISLN